MPESRTAHVRVLVDRREAIAAACSIAKPHDIVLVAGKGHEAYQEMSGQKRPFDDLQVLTDLLSVR